MTKQELVARDAPMQMTETPVPQFSFSDLHRMAVHVAKSGFFGMKDENQAMSLMLLSQADGIHPVNAARDYSIIQGQPAKKAQAIQRDFQRAGGKIEWHERTDNACIATFSHPAGGSIKVDWTLERAKVAGLGGKDNWKKYARAMLHARCVSEGCRAVYPASTGGLYTPEERQDMAADAPPVAQPMTSAIADATGAPEAAEVEAHINTIEGATQPDQLKNAFAAAWGSTHHKPTRARYQETYETMKILLEGVARREAEEATAS